MGRADLHIHTIHSDGTATVQAVLEQARRAALDIIAITDHDTLVGTLRACELAPRYGIGAIPGVEISTAEGHLLAHWVERPIPAGLPLIETLLRVGEQGGVAATATPTAQWVPSLRPATIQRALAHPDAARVLVGIEVYNAGLPRLTNNRAALRLGEALGLAQLANTDSHMAWTVGLCATAYTGVTPAALRRALETHAARPLIGRRPLVFGPAWLTQWAARLAGFGYGNARPGAAITLNRLSAIQ